jgi:putative acetyltransferase
MAPDTGSPVPPPSGVPEGEIAIDDPRAADVRDLLERHLAFTSMNSPPEDCHALDVTGLLDPSVTFYSFRRHGVLLGVGALMQLDEHHAELKSMHTAETERGAGIGRALVEHLVGVARHRCLWRVSLETGANAAFAPSRALYARAGFTPCEAFGRYRPSENSTFMTLVLTDPDSDLTAS